MRVVGSRPAVQSKTDDLMPRAVPSARPGGLAAEGPPQKMRLLLLAAALLHAASASDSCCGSVELLRQTLEQQQSILESQSRRLERLEELLAAKGAVPPLHDGEQHRRLSAVSAAPSPFAMA